MNYYMSLYLTCYSSPEELKWFERSWAKTGKKLDMGKCCVRFKKLEDLALEVIGQAIGRVPAKKYIERYEATVRSMRKPTARRKTSGRAG